MHVQFSLQNTRSRPNDTWILVFIQNFLPLKGDGDGMVLLKTTLKYNTSISFGDGKMFASSENRVNFTSNHVIIAANRRRLRNAVMMSWWRQLMIKTSICQSITVDAFNPLIQLTTAVLTSELVLQCGNSTRFDDSPLTVDCRQELYYTVNPRINHK